MDNYVNDRLACEVKRESTFLNLCSTLLESAIEDSRQEMDELAVELMESDSPVPSGVVTRLQSIDRLMQRLTNVNSKLKRLEQFLEIESCTATEQDWLELLIAAKAMYTMEQERDLFNQYFGSVLKQDSLESSDDEELSDNVSLF